ncbi:hypothetical protein ACFL1N_15065 [Thermodesulfobacteriota bacterium]
MKIKNIFQFKKLRFLPVLIILCLLFFTGIKKKDTTDAGENSPVKLVPPAITRYEPALAVRAAACVTCHAEFYSNVITDFGYGSSYFFGNPESDSKVGPFNGHIYGDFMAGLDKTGWLTAEFHKDIIVPENAAIDFNLKRAADNVLTDQSLYREAFKADSLAEYLKALEKHKKNPSHVIEKKKVFIGAPDVPTLESRFGITIGNPIDFKYIKNDENVSSDDVGIRLAENKNYYTNSGEIVIDGDLFVRGIIILNNATIVTNTGCRIYATGPIFIQGPVTFKNNKDDLSNLQLVSSEAIFLGVGLKTCSPEADADPLSLRLLKTPARPSIMTRSSVRSNISPDTLVQNLYNTAAALPLEDSTCHDENLGFSKTLLNAPIIHSRYKGKFKGLVVAEFVLFWQGETDLEFDPVFKKVPVLPVLEYSDYLIVE